MECRSYSPQPWSVPISRNFYSVNQACTSAADVLRLQYEKEILEDNLANCVTYLGVLRKKQVRTEQCLSTNPTMPRKKRKKIQHCKRELEKDIKKREREEQALLTGLQACKTNIYVLETQFLPSTAVSSTVPDLFSNSTRCSIPESESTESNWNGWSDEAVVSPFQKRSSNPFFVNDVAPDVIDEDMDTNLKSLPLPVDGSALPILPDTSHSRSALSPEATAFEPHAIHFRQGEALGQHLAELHSSSSLAINALQIKALQLQALELMEKRRLTDAGIVGATRQDSLQPIVEEGHNHTWVDTTLQQRPIKSSEGGRIRNSRMKSL